MHGISLKTYYCLLFNSLQIYCFIFNNTTDSFTFYLFIFRATMICTLLCRKEIFRKAPHINKEECKKFS